MRALRMRNTGRTFVIAAVVCTALLLIYPLKALLADYCFMKAGETLRDAVINNPDSADISEATLPAYREAIQLLRKSAGFVPSRSVYRMSLFDVYFRLGKWADAVKVSNGTLAPNALSKEESFESARKNVRAAVALNPLNGNYHLDLARLLRAEGGNKEEISRRLILAVAATPMNTALRYEVALQYLFSGDKNAALNHARVLASMDESYRLYDPAAAGDAPRRDPWYVSRLAGSYLSKSLEIAWRASGKSVESIRSLVPDNPEAQQALLLFLESKGIH